jgi:hypothetical protein
MGNNVQVSGNILEAMRRVAQATGEDINQLFDRAAEQFLAHRQVDELAAIGESHARRLGRKPSDAVRLVRDDRTERQRVRLSGEGKQVSVVGSRLPGAPCPTK